MNSSVGTPNPITMRRLLDYLAQRKSARLRRAQLRKAAARKNAGRRSTVKA